MLDLLIANGTVVDGTGAPGVRADVGVSDGRIVSVGAPGDAARRTIDAEGLVVAPGFVDVHTHYDAQVFWDPDLTPSALHGVTTAIGGNCGFTIAPCRTAEDADYLMRMLANVEGVPLSTLQAGVPWGSWSSFGEWLALVDGQLAINTGFLVGHSALRRVAMGDGAVGGGPANEAQLADMQRMLDEALAEGAMGFSSSNGFAHFDGEGDPVPSRFASDEELVALCRVLAGRPATALEYIPGNLADEAERVWAMSAAADRPLNWNLLRVSADQRGPMDRELAVSAAASRHGARIVALTIPACPRAHRNFTSGFVLSAIPGWGRLFLLDPERRIEEFSSPAVRAVMRAGVAEMSDRRSPFDLSALVLEHSVSELGRPFIGRSVGEMAAARRLDPLDALLDVVVADRLETILLTPPIGDDDESWAVRVDAWRNPDVVLGASDAGAHLDMLAAYTYFTELLGDSVREKGRIGMEEAVHLLTDRPARLYGLAGRGRVTPGWCADLTVFDPTTIGPTPVETRRDLPTGAPRLFAGATGIEHVLVNGVEVVRSGNYLGARPGTLLRAGKDTDAVRAVR